MKNNQFFNLQHLQMA